MNMRLAGMVLARKVASVMAMIIVGVAMVGSLGGCQTMTHGTTQMVTINTDPPGARAVVVGQPEQITPAVFSLPRTRNTFVTLTMDGYKPKRVPIKAQLLPERVTPKGEFMSVLGSVVDTAAGGGWELTPGELTIVMEPSAGSVPGPTGQIAPTATATAPTTSSPSTTIAKASTQPCLPALPAAEMVHIKQAGAAATASAPPSRTPAPVASAQADLSAVEYRLRQLENLKQRGLITEGEYIAMRREVLASVVAGTTGGLAAGGE